MTSRAVAGATGAHRDVVLGVPARRRSRCGSSTGWAASTTRRRTTRARRARSPAACRSRPCRCTTPALASPDRYMFGAVENSTGGCTNGSCYYHSMFWLYIIDRQGRVVWYYADATSNATLVVPAHRARRRVHLDREAARSSGSGTPSVLKMTLDRQYSQTVQAPDLSDCIDVTSDGSLLYDDRSDELHEMTKAGTSPHRSGAAARAFGASFNATRTPSTGTRPTTSILHVVSGREHDRPDRSQDRRPRRDLRRRGRAATRSRRRPGSSSSSTSRTSRRGDADGVVAPAGLRRHDRTRPAPTSTRSWSSRSIARTRS